MIEKPELFMKDSAREPIWLCDILSPKALLVVAHPDDETIFAGGLILKYQDTQWIIICCTTENDTRRENEFISACKFFEEKSHNKIQPIPLNLSLNQQHSKEQLIDKLKLYAKDDFDIVLTHNRQGEYGKDHHKMVHHCVIKSIAHPNTWVFISPGSSNVNQDELKSKKRNGNITEKLSPEIIKMKLDAFQKCHKSQADLYGYIDGKLRDSNLKETLSWYFEETGNEQFAYYM